MLHELQNGTEPFEVELLGGSEWMFLEEGDDTLHQVPAPLHGEAAQGLAVARVVLLLDHFAAPEDPNQVLEHVLRTESLDDRELVLDLPTRFHSRIPHDSNREAAFPVDEADDPLLNTWSFLLIVRTARIFTSHDTILRWCCDMDEYQADTRVFQHMVGCTVQDRSWEGQRPAHTGRVYLRTVIVTAAVYWGLGSELRPKTNPSP
jgi:hypothetical protein